MLSVQTFSLIETALVTSWSEFLNPRHIDLDDLPIQAVMAYISITILAHLSSSNWASRIFYNK